MKSLVQICSKFIAEYDDQNNDHFKKQYFGINPIIQELIENHLIIHWKNQFENIFHKDIKFTYVDHRHNHKTFVSNAIQTAVFLRVIRIFGKYCSLIVKQAMHRNLTKDEEKEFIYIHESNELDTHTNYDAIIQISEQYLVDEFVDILSNQNLANHYSKKISKQANFPNITINSKQFILV